MSTAKEIKVIPLPAGTDEKLLAEKIVVKGHRTGSRMFKVATPDSDYDIVISHNDAGMLLTPLVPDWENYLSDYDQAPDGAHLHCDASQSLFLMLEGCRVNLIIPAHPTLGVKVWQKATDMMCALAGEYSDVLMDKRVRIALFEHFRTLARDIIAPR
jgi:hypothetical protein